jgi:pimeloyl-ACP methyl ester carboxylesterase
MSVRTTLLVITTFLAGSLFAQTSERNFITINKKKIAYKIFGLENRKANEPVVVFESGLGSGGGSFESMIPNLSKNMAGIVYDRNGIGDSEMDTSIKTDVDVVNRLHNLLLTLKINPPYLMVGHSIGGPFIRLYASIFPNDICGLLFIDPTNFMLTKGEDEQVKKETSSATGYREIWSIMLTQMSTDTSASIGFRTEVKRELAESSPSFFKNYASLAPLNDIPVTVLISYNKPIEYYETQMNTQLKLGINLKPWWKELDRLRINHYSEMIENNHESRIILLPGYSHGIHNQDPKLVADAIADTYDKCLKVAKK